MELNIPQGREWSRLSRSTDDAFTWSKAKQSSLSQAVADCFAGPHVSLDARKHSGADLAAACVEARARQVPVTIEGGDVDLTAGPGPSVHAFRPTAPSEAPLLVCARPEQGGVKGGRFWEMDSNTTLLGLDMANLSGAAMRPRAGAPLRNFGGIGLRFINGGPAYIEEMGAGEPRSDHFLRWCEFFPQLRGGGNNVFTFSSERFVSRDNLFRKGGSAVRRHQRSGGYGTRMIDNLVEDGFTHFNFLAQSGGDDGGQPWKFPNWQSPEDEVIEGNNFGPAVEEAVSWDAHCNVANGHPCLGIGRATSKDGTKGAKGPRIVFDTKAFGTTSDGRGGATGPGPVYGGMPNTLAYRRPVGRFLQIIEPGPLCGKIAQVAWIDVKDVGRGYIDLCGLYLNPDARGLRPRRPNSFDRRPVAPWELSAEDFDSLPTSFAFWVGDIAFNNTVRNNRFGVYGFGGRNSTAVALWGMGVGMTIEDNELIDLGRDPDNKSMSGIALCHVSGIARKADTFVSGIDLVERAQFNLAYVDVLGNKMGGLPLMGRNASYDVKARELPASAPWRCIGNTECFGGGPAVANWAGRDGEHSPSLPAFQMDSASVHSNS